jgi:hypothetical protein
MNSHLCFAEFQHLLEQTIAMQQAEQRKTLRRSIRYPGVIDLGGDQTPIPCTLCDASQDGAQLLIDDSRPLPDGFVLVLGYDGTARRLCKVVWRSENQVGVEFIKRLPTASRPEVVADAPDQPSKTDDPVDIESLPGR